MNLSFETWIILAIVAAAAVYVMRRVIRVIRLKDVGCECRRTCSAGKGEPKERLHKIEQSR